MSLDDLASETVSDIRRQYFEKLNKLKKRELNAKDMVQKYAAERDFARQEQRKVEAINNWLVSEIDYLKQELEELQCLMWNGASDDHDFPDMQDFLLGGWN